MVVRFAPSGNNLNFIALETVTTVERDKEILRQLMTAYGYRLEASLRAESARFCHKCQNVVFRHPEG